MTAQAELNPYPRYRASGVAWLGDVPEHWDVRRLKASVSDVVNLTSRRLENEAYIALEHVESWTGKIREAGSEVQFDSQVKRFDAGDVLFGKLRPYLAKVAQPAYSGVCVGEFLVLRPSNGSLLPGYLARLLRSKPIIDAIDATTFGAKMPRADWHTIGNMAQLLPPLDEQAAIVRYLEYADGRIRRYVGAKGRLIALLEEERQAVVNQAVTRGLDASVALKPSGVEWLGDVPAHWEVRRLKSLCKLVNGATPSTNQPSYWNGDIQWITPQDLGNLAGKYITESERRITAAGYRSCGTALAPAGSIAISTRAPIGHIAVLASDACVNQGCRLLVPGDRCDSDYLYYQLTTVRNELEAQGQGSTFTELSRDKLAAFQVAAPPKDEQAAIVEYVDRATAGIDAAMARARRQMELVEEYRVRLIADVVTGKVDVRDGAAGLPGDCP